MLAADAVRGNYAGPRSPGTVFSLMYRLGNSGQVHQPKGGMGAVSEAFLSSARKAGCDIRTGMGVAEITVSEDRTTGVRLEDGSVILADFVLSSAGPKQTMGMAGVEHFDVEAARRIRNIRCKGTVAKLNLVLKSAPEFPGLSIKQQAARLVVAPSVTYVERAFNPVKYDELPTAPTIEFVLPTLIDPDLWPDGEHVLSAVVQYVPHTPKGGWTQKARQTLTDTILRTLETYMPGLGGLIKQSQLLTPSDIEAQTGAPGGHWHHAEMGIDQILTVRPVNGLAHYQFAVSGLYLCGASAHPGGDVTGAPGRNAALQLLKDEGQR